MRIVLIGQAAFGDLGVFSAMGLMKAALRAPDAVLLPTDFERYLEMRDIVRKLKEMVPLASGREAWVYVG